MDECTYLTVWMKLKWAPEAVASISVVFAGRANDGNWWSALQLSWSSSNSGNECDEDYLFPVSNDSN